MPNILPAIMQSASRMASAGMQGAQQQDQIKLDPMQQNNLMYARKVLSEAGPEELKALLPWAAKYGIDVEPYQVQAGITTEAEQRRTDDAALIGQFFRGMFGGGAQQARQAPPPTQPTATPTTPAAQPTTKQTTPTAQTRQLKRLEKNFYSNWSVRLETDAKGNRSISFTSRKPASEEEKIKGDYITRLSEDQRMELAQSLLEGATNIQTEERIAKDGSKIERTVGYRGARNESVFEGPWRVVAQSTAERMAEQVQTATAVQEAAPSTEIERSYQAYAKANQDANTPILPLSDWRTFTAIEGQNALLRSFGAPRDAMGNMLKTLVEGPKGQELRVKRAGAWMKVRAMAKQYGIPDFTLQTITERVFADLLLRDEERQMLEEQHQNLEERLNAGTAPATQ